MIVVPTTELLAELAAKIAVGPPAGPLHGAEVHLYQNNIQITPDVQLSDLVECDFDGYAPGAALTWAAPVPDGTGGAITYGGCVNFTATDGAKPNTAYGYYLTDTGATKVLYVEPFDTPAGFDANGGSLVVLIAYRQTTLPAGS